MKLLYICGTYCPAFGGAEISVHELLKRMQKDYGVDILVVTDKRFLTKGCDTDTYEGIRLKGVSHSERIRQITKTIEEYAPDCILTQLMWSDVALALGKRLNIATIYRVCTMPINIDLRLDSSHGPTRIISISKAVRQYIKREFGRESTLLQPLVNKKM